VTAANVANRDIVDGHSVNKLESSDIPLLAQPRGGVAERSKKYREASADREAGVVSRGEQKENHPGCVGFSLGCALSRLRFAGFANFFDDAATPPCSDARRGITLACNFS
jgi:hypothetical protein